MRSDSPWRWSTRRPYQLSDASGIRLRAESWQHLPGAFERNTTVRTLDIHYNEILSGNCTLQIQLLFDGFGTA